MRLGQTAVTDGLCSTSGRFASGTRVTKEPRCARQIRRAKNNSGVQVTLAALTCLLPQAT